MISGHQKSKNRQGIQRDEKFDFDEKRETKLREMRDLKKYERNIKTNSYNKHTLFQF